MLELYFARREINEFKNPTCVEFSESYSVNLKAKKTSSADIVLRGQIWGVRLRTRRIVDRLSEHAPKEGEAFYLSVLLERLPLTRFDDALRNSETGVVRKTYADRFRGRLMTQERYIRFE